MEGIVEESTKAIFQLTMASSTTTAASSSSSSGARSKKAMKRELKMKHKEEETRIKEEKRGGPKDKKLNNKNKDFQMEEEMAKTKAKAKAKATGPFDSTTTATATASSSHQTRSEEALKRELKMKHKEEETRLKEDIRGGPKDKKHNKNKDFHMEEEMAKPKGPFEVYDGLMNKNGEMIPFDQARVILFKEYKERAEALFGHPVTRFVVIIPPNSYDPRLHKMIRDAARTAGLELKRIIVKGPNAEQYPYGLSRRHGDPITTLNFSGPTFGMTIDDYQNIPEICYQASGTVFDNQLDETVEYMKLVHGVDFTEDPSALQDLSEALERASATKSKVMVKLPAAAGDDQITERTVTLGYL